jgi:acetyltransferase
MKENLSALFSPKSVVVVGASHDVGSVGNDVVKNLLEGGFSGDIFLVNPKGGELFGKRVYANISEISENIDLAVIITPAYIVPNVLRECAEKSVRAAIVISAGFRETGNGELEEEIIAIAQESHIALLGPNCLGISIPRIGLNASFAPIIPKRGNVAFLSQSGALCASVLDWAREYEIGFSAFVSTGNKAALAERELLEYVLQDEQTDVIALYVEDMRDTEELISFLRSTTVERKPIIVLKSGATDAGKQASSSHTGALAGTNEGYDALFRQSGMIRVKDTRELFLAIRGFSSLGTNRSVKRIAVITNAGGPGVLVADAISEHRLQLAELSETSKSHLAASLPAAASVANPVDVLGDADAKRYEIAIETLSHDDGVDAILVVLTPQTMTEVSKTARVIADASRVSRKPIFVAFLGADLVEEGMQILQESSVPACDHPHDAVFALSVIEKYRKRLAVLSNSSAVTTIPSEASFETLFGDAIEQVNRRLSEFCAESVFAIGETQTLPILSLFGLRTLRTEIATTANEAKRIAESIDKPVALKIVSPDILHKSDVGGVSLDILPENVESAYETMCSEVVRRAPKARIEGIAVVEMAPKEGVLMTLGMKRDTALGPVVMVGLGGIYVETLRDTAFGILPLTREDALEMVQSLRSYPILAGARGQGELDVDAFADVIVLVANISRAIPSIVELDINPLLVLPKGDGVIALDGRMVLEKL